MKITRKQLRKIINESLEMSFKRGTTQQQKHAMIDQLGTILSANHARFETEFVNEIGNEIQIAIEDFDCGSADQLTISMIGPNSQTENTITRMEAVELHRLLGDYLDKTQGSLEKKYKPGDYEVLDYDSDDNQVPDHMEKF